MLTTAQSNTTGPDLWGRHMLRQRGRWRRGSIFYAATMISLCCAGADARSSSPPPLRCVDGQGPMKCAEHGGARGRLLWLWNATPQHARTCAPPRRSRRLHGATCDGHAAPCPAAALPLSLSLSLSLSRSPWHDAAWTLQGACVRLWWPRPPARARV
jgi:hypothetical protein